jgi:hypothetical protein
LPPGLSAWSCPGTTGTHVDITGTRSTASLF